MVNCQTGQKFGEKPDEDLPLYGGTDVLEEKGS